MSRWPKTKLALCSCLLVATAALNSPALAAQGEIGEVESLQLIAQGAGGFPGSLDPGDAFGAAVAALGDINGDGIDDLAIGADGDDDGGTDRGAVWVLFMAADGSVSSTSKISDTSGGFSAGLANNAGFGRALAGLGDLDGDGTPDLAVGSGGGGFGSSSGAVFVLFLNPDGTVKSSQKIDKNSGGFTGWIFPNDGFGGALANLGDLDGNGVIDIAVGANRDSTLGLAKGAVWILFLLADGTVASHAKISDATIGGALTILDRFGASVSAVDDLDGNGVNDLAVGAVGDNDGPGLALGAVYLLRLDSAGGVIGTSKISATSGGFTGSLSSLDAFGSALTLLDDLDDNGVRELAVGAPGDDDTAPLVSPGTDRGAAWILFLDGSGSVASHVKISEASGGFGVSLINGAGFGSSLTAADLDGDGFLDPMSGVPGATGGGASFQMFLVTPAPEEEQPYEGAITTFDGRPGRATLVVIPPDGTLPPPPDFIGNPVLIVPQTDGGLVRARDISGGSGTAMGSFGEGANYPTGEGPAQANSGNFDSLSSGLLGGSLAALSDFVTANSGSDSVSVLTSNLDGTFQPAVHTALAVDTQPIAIQVGDFDGDLLDDVAVAGASGVTVMLGDGMSGFTTQTFIPVANLTDLAVGFVDDDAFLDVVTTSGSIALGPGMESGFATVLLGNGDGSLTGIGSFAPGQMLASVLLGEMTQDGNLDAMIVTHQFDAGPSGEPQGLIQVYAGNGAGGFTLSSSFSGHATPDVGGTHPTYGALADIDGDMLLDAVYTSTSSLAYPIAAFADQHPPVVLTVLIADGSGDFDVSTLGTAYSGKGVSAVLEDFSLPKDSMADVVLVWHEDNLAGTGAPDEQEQTFLALLEGNGAASIFNDSTPSQYPTGDEPGDGFLGDVDGGSLDGSSSLDIVVPNRASNSLTVLLNNGDGTFTAAPDVVDVDDTVSPGPSWVGGPRVAHFGGDMVLSGPVVGFPLLSYNAWEDTGPFPDPTVLASISAFTGGPGGVFTKELQLPLPRGGDFAQLDMDADSVADFIVTQYVGAPSGADAVHIYRGLGPHPPVVDTTPLVTLGPAGHRLTGGLHITDLLGTDLPDVLTTSIDISTGEGHIVVFENSAGTLLPATVWPMGANWTSIRDLDVGDLTGDEVFDVAVGEADGRLFLAVGAPDGSFVPAPPETVLGNIAGGALALAEITGDGLLDLVSSSDLGVNGLGQAYVRTARGDGATLGMLQTVAGLASTDADGKALRPMIDDLDADGTLELVLIHGGSNTLSVFPNAFDTFQDYGLDKPGLGGFTPTLSGNGYTVPGANTQFVIADGRGGAPALVQIGVGRTPDLFPAVAMVINQFIVPLSGPAGVPGVGSFATSLTLPTDPSFLGIEFTVQAIVLDGAAGSSPAPSGFSVTKGLAFTLVE